MRKNEKGEEVTEAEAKASSANMSVENYLMSFWTIRWSQHNSDLRRLGFLAPGTHE